MASKKKDFFELAHKRFEQAEDAEKDQRERERSALAFYAGGDNQWDPDVLRSRRGLNRDGSSSASIAGAPTRPALTINLTREPVRQVLNQERNADLGVYLIPADDFGGLQEPISDDEIKLREGLVRRIQRDSEAADARTWAFSRATIAGRGYYGVMTRYVPGKTTDQEIYVQRFYNQASVLLDPAHEQPDGSDADWAFVGTDVPWEQYKAKYGERNGKKNRVCNTSDTQFRALGDEAPGWFTFEGKTRICRVVDYYYTSYTSKELAMFEDGSAEWVSDLPKSDTREYTTRTVVDTSIHWCQIDGCDDDKLDETDWPGRYIPIIKVIGEELQPYDKDRQCEGMVRPAMDSCRSFNYMVSKWVEQIGLAPIPPWIMAAGQDEGFEAEWAASTTRTLPALHYNQKDVNSQLAPPPARTSITTDISAIAASVQMFKESITDTMGVPPSSLGHIDPTLKSGKAIQAVLQQAERGTSNYLDNLVRSMRHEGRIINDLLFPIYGRPGRIARMMTPTGQMETVQLGYREGQQPPPQMAGGQQPQMGQPDQPGAKQPPKVYSLTKDAEWNVAVKIAKHLDTRRQQEAEITSQIIASDPSQMAIIGDLFFENLDGPGHDEMARRYKAVLDPRVLQTLQGQQPIPPQVQAQMQQMQQAIEQLKPLADKNMADLQGKQLQEQAESQREQLAKQVELQKAELDNQTRLKIAEINAESQRQLEMRKLEVELEIEMAKLGNAQAMARAQIEQEQLHQHGEQMMQREQQEASNMQADLDRQAARDQQQMKAEQSQSEAQTP